jgi:hypothetical protein
MAKKLYPTDTLDQAQFIIAAWKNINESLAFGPLTYESFSADLEAVDSLQRKIVRLQTELLEARNERDAAHIDIWSKVKRARAGIKAAYGDDSVEYEMAGGTRLSERKKPRRKTLSVSQAERSVPEQIA